MRADERRDDAVKRVGHGLATRNLGGRWAKAPEDDQAAWLGYVAAGRLRITRRFRAFALVNRLREGTLVGRRPPRRRDTVTESLLEALLDALLP